jgi:glucose dehydrogenase
VDACTRSLALGIGAFTLVLVGVASSATPAGLALAAAGILLYAAARRALGRC